MRVHPRRDRGEPCAPKAEFVPGLLGSRLERRQGRPYQQSCGRREGAGYLGASGRASVRALLAVKRRSPSRRRRLGLRWRSRARAATVCHGTDAVWPVATW